MIDMEKHTSAACDEKTAFMWYFERIIRAREGLCLEDEETVIRAVLIEARDDEKISVRSFVSLVVNAYTF